MHLLFTALKVVGIQIELLQKAKHHLAGSTEEAVGSSNDDLHAQKLHFIQSFLCLVIIGTINEKIG